MQNMPTKEEKKKGHIWTRWLGMGAFQKRVVPIKKKKSKLMPRGDGPFKVLTMINDNAYKLDLPS